MRPGLVYPYTASAKVGFIDFDRSQQRQGLLTDSGHTMMDLEEISLFFNALYFQRPKIQTHGNAYWLRCPVA